MSFLIDTDICSAHLRGMQRVTNRFLQHSGRLHISAVTLGELMSWTRRANCPPKYHDALLKMLVDFDLVDVTADVGRRFGETRAALLDVGRPIATIDLLIAATAIVYDLTVVTHNIGHFGKVPGVKVEDWLGN